MEQENQLRLFHGRDPAEIVGRRALLELLNVWAKKWILCEVFGGGLGATANEHAEYDVL
jgi:hypothetical protein